MDIMIDLETLGTNADAPVISIGAVKFNKKGIEDEFYINLDITEQINDGRRVNGETLKWWMTQSGAAKKVFKETQVKTKFGLNKFTAFCMGNGDVSPWGNGATFDITIIEHLLTQYNEPIPWKFWNVMDLRTFRRFVHYGSQIKRDGIHHNALDDAKYQAKIVIEGMNK